MAGRTSAFNVRRSTLVSIQEHFALPGQAAWAQARLSGKVAEWLDECLKNDAVALHTCSVRNMLDHGQQHWRRESETEYLHAWLSRWLHQPLNYLWMDDDNVVTLQDQHPFKLGHHLGSWASAMTAGAQSVEWQHSNQLKVLLKIQL